jgi:hypothetical protein
MLEFKHVILAIIELLNDNNLLFTLHSPLATHTMTDLPSPKDAARLLQQLGRGGPGRHRRVAEQVLSPAMTLLRTWQMQRLVETHADFLSNPRYRPATQFFLSDIYAPRDFSQRNHDIERMYQSMLKVLPQKVIHTLAVITELHQFTDELDQLLLEALVERLGVSDSITAVQYAAAYRICNNYDDRAKQIAMLVEVGQGVERLVRLPFIGATLRLARGPARLAGWQALQDFLERGFAAFKEMRGAAEFLATVQRRELLILDRIFATHPDPFQLP